MPEKMSFADLVARASAKTRVVAEKEKYFLRENLSFAEAGPHVLGPRREGQLKVIPSIPTIIHLLFSTGCLHFETTVAARLCSSWRFYRSAAIPVLFFVLVEGSQKAA